MAPPIVSATLQTLVLALLSSLLAQAITAYRKEVPLAALAIDWTPILQYLLFTLISTPPNFQWQQLLESSFPSSSNGRLSKSNTAKKLLLDQTLAAAANTLLYTTFFRALNPASASSLLEDSLPLFLAGLRLWPLVALVNFTLVRSVAARNLVSGVAGLGWGVYLCLATV